MKSHKSKALMTHWKKLFLYFQEYTLHFNTFELPVDNLLFPVKSFISVILLPAHIFIFTHLYISISVFFQSSADFTLSNGRLVLVRESIYLSLLLLFKVELSNSFLFMHNGDFLYSQTLAPPSPLSGGCSSY
jgi:hypothetical protein